MTYAALIALSGAGIGLLVARVLEIVGDIERSLSSTEDATPWDGL